jgi:hypothetical protein
MNVKVKTIIVGRDSGFIPVTRREDTSTSRNAKTGFKIKFRKKRRRFSKNLRKTLMKVIGMLANTMIRDIPFRPASTSVIMRTGRMMIR